MRMLDDDDHDVHIINYQLCNSVESSDRKKIIGNCIAGGLFM